MGNGVEKQFSRWYRPSTLDGYIGNTAVKETIQNILKRGKLPQSILLHGMTGCGKTTLARLIAKEYLCENRSLEHGACGVCDTCLAVDEYIRTGDYGALVDLKEVDITQSSGKDDMTALLDEMSYPSYTGGWKVYIMDEVQLASKQAQQRMLKYMEEPTEKVLVIFCTTNPEMLLDTLKNRCSLKLQIKKPNLSELIGLLKFVCEKEGISYDLQGLKLVCAKSDFVIRESLQLLEQITHSRGSVTEESFVEEFKELGDSALFEFFKAYLYKDSLKYLSILHQVRVMSGFDVFLGSTLSFIERGIYVVNGIPVEGLSSYELDKYSKLFKKFSEEEIGFLLSSLLKLRGSRDLEGGLMCLLFEQPNNREVVVVGGKGETRSSQIAKEASFREVSMHKREKEIMNRSKESIKDLNNPVEDISKLFNLKKVEG